MTIENAEPKLAPPGAGLPWHQWLSLRFVLLPLVFKASDWQRSIGHFEREGKNILALIPQCPPQSLATRALVPKMRGLEDSSRYWSVAMTAEHLIIVGELMQDIIVKLSQGIVPPGKVKTADVKPQGALPTEEVQDKFAQFQQGFLGAMKTNVVDRQSKARYAHPWFGPLTAQQWLTVAALHQRLHRVQIEEIMARISR